MPVNFDELVLNPIMVVFGEPLVWITPTGQSVPFIGVYTAAFSEAKFSAGEAVSTDRPRIGLRSAQFTGGLLPAQGDTILRGAAAFVISGVNDDSIGHMHLTVMQADD